MFTFACSNMMMSGDGKSHIYQGDSFSASTTSTVAKLNPTVSFLNPPYDVGEDGQLEFIEHSLETLNAGGRCVAIVQMSCATSNSANTVAVRERLLAKHTLSAVFSMPPEVFHPVGVITCMMIFEAKKPHTDGFKTFFGYFKDDGFTKTKHLGRIDTGRWAETRAKWLSVFRNREVELGLSVLHEVGAADEWCAEAYMETDYSILTRYDFEETLKNFAVFRLVGGTVKPHPEGDE